MDNNEKIAARVAAEEADKLIQTAKDMQPVLKRIERMFTPRRGSTFFYILHWIITAALVASNIVMWRLWIRAETNVKEQERELIQMDSLQSSQSGHAEYARFASVLSISSTSCESGVPHLHTKGVTDTSLYLTTGLVMDHPELSMDISVTQSLIACSFGGQRITR